MFYSLNNYNIQQINKQISEEKTKQTMRRKYFEVGIISGIILSIQISMILAQAVTLPTLPTSTTTTKRSNISITVTAATLLGGNLTTSMPRIIYSSTTDRYNDSYVIGM